MENTKKPFIKLDPNRRILFLTKDHNLLLEQLYNGLNIKMCDITPKELLDDINTDIITPAWVCFHHDPKEIAKRAYAGLLHNGKRIFNDNALLNGNFQAIVSGKRKGTGSSRETAAQCEKFSGINLIFAESFAPIHQRNNINLGQLMGNYNLLRRLQAGEEISIEEFIASFDEFSQKILRAGGLFSFLDEHSHHSQNEKNKPISDKPMSMAQKIIASKIISNDIDSLINQKSFLAKVDSGYSHEFTTAQVHLFLKEKYGINYEIKNATNFAAFEDHLIYADQVKTMKPFLPLIEQLRKIQVDFIKRNNIKDYSAKNGISPGICHEVARQEMIMPKDFVQATDSHTCMGGALNCLAYGVGATEYAALLKTGITVVQIPKPIRFELIGKLKYNCTAKDIILHILRKYSKHGITLNKIMEFGGTGMGHLSLDERATLCNMATECGAKAAICEPDDKLVDWLLNNRPGISKDKITSLLTRPDKNYQYEESYLIELNLIEPMVAHPGRPELGIPSDPTNGELVKNLPNIKIDIAYGGSCTAGKFEDIDMYAKVTESSLKRGGKIKRDVQFYIQYGSKKVAEYAKEKGYHRMFQIAGIKIIPPGCGACIGCGPGVSYHKEQVTVSAINRNFDGRSGPGKLYLASPLTVAASAFAGKITAWEQDD